MKRILIILLVTFASTMQAQTQAQRNLLTVDAKGEKLSDFYKSQHVEDLWLAGHHVNWETGTPDSPNATHNIKTHCSVFAASVCKKLKIYILRPPEHGQGLLANAQATWLEGKTAGEKGWRKITEARPYEKAQDWANKGYVVIAIYQNPDRHKPGHIALIMPDKMSIKTLNESGPRIIQAGKNNYNSASLLQGFKNHISSWPSDEVLFYYNVNEPF